MDTIKTDAALANRWQAAYGRVQEKCLSVRKDSRNVYLVASTSGKTYEVRGRGNVATSCSCEAAVRFDEVCWHRAAVYALIGAFDPAPAAVAPVADRSLTEADRALVAFIGAAWDAWHAPHGTLAYWAAANRMGAAMDAATAAMVAAGMTRDAAYDRLSAAEMAAR